MLQKLNLARAEAEKSRQLENVHVCVYLHCDALVSHAPAGQSATLFGVPGLKVKPKTNTSQSEVTGRTQSKTARKYETTQYSALTRSDLVETYA